MALADLARAADEQILIDERRETTIVLGERGRAHVFNDKGNAIYLMKKLPGHES